MALIDRFWSKVAGREDPEGCWVWTAAKVRDTYGVFWDGGRLVYAHRFLYELVNGVIADKMDLDHSCHNKACVNPSHLRVCTRSQNLCNRSKGSRNTSGFKGVSAWKNGRWQAYINHDRKRIPLGLFGTKEEAFSAYCEASKKLHKEFSNVS